MKPGDSILIPGYGEYYAALASEHPTEDLNTCVSRHGKYCEGIKTGLGLCVELPCSSFDQYLVFFKKVN